MSATARILMATCALAALALPPAALARDTTPPTSQKVDQLFVQSADHGTLTRSKKVGSFDLALSGTARQTHSVYCCIEAPDHRFVTQESQIPTGGFMRSWASFGFKADHPGSVLNLLHGAPNADTVALELSHPRISRRGRISYQARLRRHVGSNLHGYASQLDRRLPSHFGAASLYIDQETASVAGGCTGGACGIVNGCAIQPYTRCSGVDLNHADLRKSNLNHAFMTKANLSYANLSQANLGDANVSGANLSNATLEQVNLGYATLYGADLSSADLHQGGLGHATVVFADLHNADLTDANITDSDFGGADLTGADLTGAIEGSPLDPHPHSDPLSGAILCHTTMPDGSINNDGC